MMSIYPSPPIKPLRLTATGSADATAAITGIQEPPGIQPGGVMYLRVALSDPGAPPTSSATPTLRLCAGTGEPVELPISTVRVYIYNRPGTEPSDRVARANINPDLLADDVYQVEITLDKPGNLWTLQLQNNDAKPRDVVCVVAGEASQSQQPWLDLPEQVSYGLVDKGTATPATLTRSLTVTNKGTGTLRIAASDQGPIGLSPFTVSALPAPIAPNARDTLTIRFDLPATPGTSHIEYAVKSNDQTALVNNPHNKRVTLAATLVGITGISQPKHQQGDTITVAINGHGLATTTAVLFAPAAGIVTRNVHATPAAVYVTLDLTQATPGVYPFHIQTLVGNIDSDPHQFTVVPRPVVNTITPTKHMQGESPLLAIAGQNLDRVANVLFAEATGITTRNVQTTPTTVTVTLDLTNAVPGSYPFQLRTPYGNIASGDMQFAVAYRPLISKITPARLAHGEKALVTIEGQYLGDVTNVVFAPAAGISTQNVQATPTAVNATLDLTKATPGIYSFQIQTPYSTVDSGRVQFTVTYCPAKNEPPWTGGWTNIQPVNRVQQSFQVADPSIRSIEVAITNGNPGPEGDNLTLQMLNGNGTVLVEQNQDVAEGFDGWLKFDLPNDGLRVTPGEMFYLLLQDTGKVAFGWKYGADTYPGGNAIFYGKPDKGRDYFFRVNP